MWQGNIPLTRNSSLGYPGPALAVYAQAKQSIAPTAHMQQQQQQPRQQQQPTHSTFTAH